MGVVGVTAGMGITTYISCTISYLGFGSCSSLIVTLDIWYDHWDNDFPR